jgi:hypothetical protein
MVDICTTGLLNCTDVIGSIIVAGATNLTGDLFLMLMAILIVMVALCLAFGMPLELVMIGILPICLAFGSFYGQFLAPIGVILIYFSFLIATKWIFK